MPIVIIIIMAHNNTPTASSDFMMSPELADRSGWGGGATFLEWEIDRFQSSLIQVVLKAGFLSYERNIASVRSPRKLHSFSSSHSKSTQPPH